ncbi:MAG: ROK family protein [Anaerolineales bacterium]
MTLYGGIEGGGTKFVCALGNEQGEILKITRFPTTTPAETLSQALEFFRPYAGELASVGIGSFGPVDLNPQSPTFGYVTTTPKPGWSWADVAGPLRTGLGVPVGFELDVNIAAMGEHRWGAAQGLDTFVYLTIGTGIGGGAMVEGKLLHGTMHPEMGHILLRHDWEADPFAGACPFHGDCFEGLAAGPAIEKRWGQKGDTLGVDHPAWTLEAHYVALGLVSFICTLSPQRIIIGGGVMQQPHLFPMVRAKVQTLLNGYLQIPALLEGIEAYIVPPALGGEAGVKGALALAFSVA